MKQSVTVNGVQLTRQQVEEAMRELGVQDGQSINHGMFFSFVPAHRNRVYLALNPHYVLSAANSAIAMGDAIVTVSADGDVGWNNRRTNFTVRAAAEFSLSVDR